MVAFLSKKRYSENGEKILTSFAKWHYWDDKKASENRHEKSRECKQCRILSSTLVGNAISSCGAMYFVVALFFIVLYKYLLRKAANQTSDRVEGQQSIFSNSILLEERAVEEEKKSSSLTDNKGQFSMRKRGRRKKEN
uniref:Uncharacterized protein n=1 Tax=Romanomermis culicivorax TaxID=13658 RepID=A0A915HWD4_ROMCU